MDSILISLPLPSPTSSFHPHLLDTDCLVWESCVGILTSLCGGIRGWGFGRRMGSGGGALRSGISAFIKETPEKCLPPSAVRTQREDGCPRTRKRVLTRHGVCWHRELGLADSGTMSNTFLLFVSQPVCGILLQHPEGAKTPSFSLLFLKA